MSNQPDTRWISELSCIPVSNIAQKCIEPKINMTLRSDRGTMNP
jgi:hypothetical protein